MSAISFLTIDNESISLERALKYLRAAGGYRRFLADIVRQYVLEKELKSRPDIQADAFRVDQAIIDFRVQSQLTDPNRFRQWLSSQSITYEDFQSQVAFGISVEKLKAEAIAESDLRSDFAERQSFFDRVLLSRIVLPDRASADRLQEEILSDGSKFGSLAREHSLTPDRMTNGMMGAVRRGTLPDILKTAVSSGRSGELIGPLEIDGRYCLFRIEKFLSANFEEIKPELLQDRFQNWLQSKIDALTIKLEVDNSSDDL